MISPKIQLFNAIFSKSLALGYSTYQYNPSEGTNYPFIHVGESVGADVIDNKQVITGRISQAVHVWGYADNKALFEDMVFNIEQAFRSITTLDNYYVRLLAMDSNSIYDNTTTDNLLHGIITAEYKLS